ncbi:hypothetical protein IQ22_04040 [Pseudomonas duriflava]|uniref:Uncharacterized protein n=1 Tax=Pseudomonas duriflava TaxID=459528 RepID=A0A562PXX2_9PSED|nr:hypothetical protein [Pseudomonas duriflava]TWI49238.1 hypothetical protein IQ22_04040 [Pseudomonas duriflava]
MTQAQKAPDDPEIDRKTPPQPDRPIGDDPDDREPPERLPQKNPTDPEYS